MLTTVETVLLKFKHKFELDPRLGAVPVTFWVFHDESLLNTFLIMSIFELLSNNSFYSLSILSAAEKTPSF